MTDEETERLKRQMLEQSKLSDFIDFFFFGGGWMLAFAALGVLSAYLR